MWPFPGIAHPLVMMTVRLPHGCRRPRSHGASPAEQLLIQSDKLNSLGVMAGGIAHELRNPLTIITVSAELAQSAPNDLPLRTECLEKIGASAKRASLIIESLLKFARPQTDTAVVIDVKELLEATFSFTSDELVLHWVRPSIEVKDNGAKVLGSPVLLQQCSSI